MGFEVIVRPAVFPNIRPAPPRVLAPDDDQSMATIGGSGGGIIGTSYSSSISISRSKSTEQKRRVDEVRVYQKDDDGGATRSTRSINRDNYIDVEVLNKLWINYGAEDSEVFYKKIEESDNIEILRRNVIKEGG